MSQNAINITLLVDVCDLISLVRVKWGASILISHRQQMVTHCPVACHNLPEKITLGCLCCKSFSHIILLNFSKLISLHSENTTYDLRNILHVTLCYSLIAQSTQPVSADYITTQYTQPVSTHHITTQSIQYQHTQGRPLGGASGALAPGADFEGAPKRRSLTSHTLIRSTVAW
jgi:hypothetical protein